MGLAGTYCPPALADCGYRYDIKHYRVALCRIYGVVFRPKRVYRSQRTARHDLADVPARPIGRHRHLASASGTRSRELSTAIGVH